MTMEGEEMGIEKTKEKRWAMESRSEGEGRSDRKGRGEKRKGERRQEGKRGRQERREARKTGGGNRRLVNPETTKTINVTAKGSTSQ